MLETIVYVALFSTLLASFIPYAYALGEQGSRLTSAIIAAGQQE